MEVIRKLEAYQRECRWLEEENTRLKAEVEESYGARKEGLARLERLMQENAALKAELSKSIAREQEIEAEVEEWRKQCHFENREVAKRDHRIADLIKAGDVMGMMLNRWKLGVAERREWNKAKGE